MRQLIKTDGTVQELPKPLTLKEVYKLIDCDTVDVVNLRHMGEPLHVMIVDDNGHIRPDRKPVNAKATELYHSNRIPGTVWPIVGDVVVCPDEDFA